MVHTRRSRKWLPGAWLFGLVLLCWAPAARATVIRVDVLTDDLTVNGNCTLREAVEAVRLGAVVDACPAGDGTDVIELPPGTFVISLVGDLEDANQTGDLDVAAGQLVIRGAGSGQTTVTALALGDRVFDIRSGTVEILDLAVVNGVATNGGPAEARGGGVRVAAGVAALTMERVLLHGNHAGMGGGLHSEATALEVRDCEIRSNFSSGLGGGGLSIGGGQVLIERTVIHINNAVVDGGGILHLAGDMQLVNTTVSANTAGSNGGGLAVSGAFTVSFSTVAVNRIGNASRGGGVYSDSVTPIVIKATIVADNQRDDASPDDFHDTVTLGASSMGDNLVEAVGTSVNGWAVSDLLGVDPLLDSLADNGGGTLTHALLAGSPALDSANCGDVQGLGDVAVDQRSATRAWPLGGGCDRGAYEHRAPEHVLTSTPITAGLECAHGGFRLEFGDDLDGDGVADAQISTAFVCHSDPGENPHNALVRLDPLGIGDPACPYGGWEIYSGLDNGDGGGDADNGVLESGEEDGPPEEVCNGADGYSSLVRVAVLPVGDASCANGGHAIFAGLDNGDGAGDPGDGVLHDDEIDSGPTVACFATSGQTGQDGHNSLIRVTVLPVGDSVCPFGGNRFESGLDNGDGGGTADDGVLQDGEVDGVSTVVCHGEPGSDGPDGQEALVEVTPLPVGDASCANGGYLIESGLDDDADGILDSQEVDHVAVACDGADGTDGADSLVTVVPLETGDASCAHGGYLVATGLDQDQDGVLDLVEMDSTFWVCNGAGMELDAEGGGGCSVGAGPGPTPWLLLLFFVGAIVNRSRRRLRR